MASESEMEMRGERSKEMGASAKRNSAQGAIHAPAPRSQSRYLDMSCSSRVTFVALSRREGNSKLFTDFKFVAAPHPRIATGISER